MQKKYSLKHGLVAAVATLALWSHAGWAQQTDSCQTRTFTAAEERMLDAFIAYYGRPADVGGLRSWVNQLNKYQGDLWVIMEDFATSVEYAQRFQHLDHRSLVDNLFLQMFGRPADPEGLNFYTNLLDTHQSTLASLALRIMDGAAIDDAAVLKNKNKVARHYIAKAEAKGSEVMNAQQMATVLATVKTDENSANAACQAFTDFIDGAGPPSTGAPQIKGKLIYHNYSTYEARDSRMFLYDFETKILKNISDGWNIRHAMNANFSPDGTKIIFMGLRHNKDTWDIYQYDLNTGEHPLNLTPDDERNEDPRFSPDGKRIIFKRNLRLAEMNMETGEITRIIPEDGHEYSMPDYNFDGTKVVASKLPDGKRNDCCSAIVAIDLQSKTVTQLYDVPDVQDYFPVNVDENSFYYSQGYSTNWRGDQVYRGFWDGRPSVPLPFNDQEGDYSDASPAGGDWVVISSTRPGTRGSYDLYLANTVSGEIISLSDYHPDINTSKAELGPVIFIQK